MNINDTIVALSTAPGAAAIAVMRLSGDKAVSIAEEVFKSRFGKELSKQGTHQVMLGDFHYKNMLIDEVLLAVFKNPNSYTGEDVVEISCHGSIYVQQKILKVLQDMGARLAEPGEFTLRAFLNKKMDLAQAEAVADLIAVESEAAHHIAVQHLRGGISKSLGSLRERLLSFASLIELELDFSEEDVALADRTQLRALVDDIRTTLKNLLDSFETGNAIKHGIPVALIGMPNAGKSSLLNALLDEEKALVSDVAGTTRDSIEDTLTIGSIQYRFIDTAGLRKTMDIVEAMGVERTQEKMDKASILMYVVDPKTQSPQAALKAIEEIKRDDTTLLLVINKKDLLKTAELDAYLGGLDRLNVDAFVYDKVIISTKDESDINALKQRFAGLVQWNTGSALVSNQRHWAALQAAMEGILEVVQGIEENRSSDLLAIDIRQTLHELGTITGEVTTDDILGNIFANFCIGK
ncbi:MAG: tRNA uridine-5-carboxymethylaminomethyl(34) synthesis GTPase MnmE [Flavobacteriaceae bacterium]|nr:tRNA uridine-5-carboxymethylaminomethyl(34) synthesis GTPase MnmE [Flavobacteriaceae bacterium]